MLTACIQDGWPTHRRALRNRTVDIEQIVSGRHGAKLLASSSAGLACRLLNMRIQSEPRRCYRALALARIQSTTSCSTQATALGEMRWCFGKAPVRSNLQIVVRESPVRSFTVRNRMSLSGT